MLEDPLPPGCEVVQDESGYEIFGEPNYQREERGWNFWWASREVRDEKVAFFATGLSSGRHEFTYLLRCQIPGSYHVMPSLASLMYYPEVRGNSGEFQFRIIE